MNSVLRSRRAGGFQLDANQRQDDEAELHDAGRNEPYPLTGLIPAIGMFSRAHQEVDAIPGPHHRDEAEHSAQERLRSPCQPDLRPCRAIISTRADQAPTSLGSQPQKRPQETSAQRPPRIVPAASNNTVIWITR